jgi:putative ABC transport system permease protein
VRQCATVVASGGKQLRHFEMMCEIVRQICGRGEQFGLGATDLVVSEQKPDQLHANAAPCVGLVRRPGRVERILIEPKCFRNVRACSGEACKLEVDLGIFRRRLAKRQQDGAGRIVFTLERQAAREREDIRFVGALSDRRAAKRVDGGIDSSGLDVLLSPPVRRDPSRPAALALLSPERDRLAAGMGQIVPVIFLAVAAFLLNVVLTRLVAVQRARIAALKALGYSDAEVSWHFVKWGLAVGASGAAVGTTAGALMGRGMTTIYTDFFHFPILEYHLPAAVVAEGLAVALMSAVIGALGAVRRVVSLPPAEAMRPEPPAPYRVSWLERAGLRRWLSQPARMVLRNLQRHPARAAMSTLGIAFGGAMLIVGTFTIDSMNQMMDTQFNVAQVYDAIVTFVEPASAAAGDDVTRLPGVVQAEGFRAVPARPRAGPRQRSVSLLGLRPDSRLNRVVDATGGVVSLPRDGVVLSAKLAELLGVGAGDEIDIDVLEGERPVRRVMVSQLVNEFMGTNAYMDIDALHRLMEEGGSLSGAYLAVDGAAESALYRQLKNTPAVAGVGFRRAAIESFRNTLAESVSITRLVTILFAAIIAFGVVYNTARIALSERGAELATLRVMGFTRAEVAYILLGELAIVTLIALPLSMAIGYGLAAATVTAFDTDVYRLPLIVTARTYAVSLLTTLVTATASALIVRRGLDRLDLIAVLKTRE